MVSFYQYGHVNERERLKEVGTRLRDLRVDRKISQQELAKMIHLTQPCVSQIENGSKTMSLVILFRLSDVFVYRPNELLAYLLGLSK